MPQPLDPRFPVAVQELWAALSADVVWLHGRWIIYRQLFGTSKERVDLLNESAGTVTWILQSLLLDDVQLSLSKISDPAGSGQRQNLTVRRLQQVLRDAGESSVADAMEASLAAFESACDKLRHRRNKWLAHSDLATRLSEKAVPLSGPSRQEVENALAPLRDVMNCVELKYTGSRTAYEHFLMQEDGEHLLSALAQGKRYTELVDSGTIPRADLLQRFPRGV
jgi:hypothetical protein